MIQNLVRRLKIGVRRHFRALLLAAITVFIIAQIIFLSPSKLEENQAPPTQVDPEVFVPEKEPTLATGIPGDKIADYHVDQFTYVSTEGRNKLWKLIADKAALYHKEDIVHARTVTANLYDPDGSVTLVTGKEGKHATKGRELEIFGDVNVTFPDGFKLKTQYLHYKPDTRRIHIPAKYFVQGEGVEEDGQKTMFESYGMDFDRAKSLITLPQQVKFIMEQPERKPAQKKEYAGVPDRTQIESDHCVIERNKQLAHFTMYPNRPDNVRFVYITQPNMYARSRRADMNYGNSAKLLQYLTAYEDVLIKETEFKRTSSEKEEKKDVLKYATGGRADFDTKRDVIILTEFPQVYQDNDTVTGDVILVHRDTDVIEVEHSNAFSTGSSQQE